MSNPTPLPWIELDQAFPPCTHAWPQGSAAPGLLAAGADLSVNRLLDAYRQGIFPWFSAGQPILWWCPDPRMVLPVAAFKCQPSLRKTLKKFTRNPSCAVRFDTAFDAVITACAGQKRPGQRGTWIMPHMVRAYQALHRAGWAHSVETWVDGQLVGGLYLVAIGQAVFGESMFSKQSDASKIALSGLVAFCRAHGIHWIDCQQNTAHLASLGAHEVGLADFCAHVAQAQYRTAPDWNFSPLYWQTLSL